MPLPKVPRVIRQKVTADATWRKRVKLISEADLVNAVNGSPFDVSLGFLPPEAVLSPAPAVKLITQFTGGGLTACTVSIGTSASPSLIMTSFDVFGAAASGLYVAGTAGAQRVVPGVHPTGGQNVIARFTPDGGHNLTGLTAGSVELTIYFFIPDSKWD